MPNARVQLRAVGAICALTAAIRRSEQALNRDASDVIAPVSCNAC